MLIATWNVNSLKARLDRVTQWVTENQPDVLCMQETKMKDEVFPALTFAEMGYESAHFGQGQWNGVAIISKVGLTDVVNNFAKPIEPDHEARIISATCGGVKVVCVYVPNGRALEDDHYKYKLGWMKKLRQHADAIAKPNDRLVIGGDFNIAPTDEDVWDVTKFEGATHVSAPERKVFAELCDWGLTDAFRELHPEPKVFSWWDYRNGSFHKGEGMRIDFLLATKSLMSDVEASSIDRNARKGEKPSDHVPVTITLKK
ncbi:MAG: exodeoxyribonuclease III [Ilumatobacteraceae bacterium]|nr:MAG: exodeoxyribonuclease III [Acidimicrobium sp. BACL27 MAG-120823-bin4]MDA3042378.1 exodeoxyribonuclease III [Actinomycetota bacterium]MDP4635163.1 exodeoxyribonuclease III [Ilumatobacteraceae bacterium]MDP4735746.1 exodeoxyribonuclease III [Ilumatobacteraceae bacterium]MDP4981924.1 exodeoxyribonuclease III [Ilumatobacteraceae bacterium]